MEDCRLNYKAWNHDTRRVSQLSPSTLSLLASLLSVFPPRRPAFGPVAAVAAAALSAREPSERRYRQQGRVRHSRGNKVVNYKEMKRGTGAANFQFNRWLSSRLANLNWLNLYNCSEHTQEHGAILMGAVPPETTQDVDYMWVWRMNDSDSPVAI